MHPMSMFNEYAINHGRRYLVTLDCLAAHVMEWDAYENFRKKGEKAIYFDDKSFSNVALCYLPAKSTAYGQPFYGQYFESLSRFVQVYTVDIQRLVE